MKTKEFIKRVNELGYYVENDSDTVIKCDGCTLARINERRPYKMNANAMVDVKDAKELFNLCTEYARTPIDEREEEKKFYLQKIRSFYECYLDKDLAFLNFKTSNKTYFLNTTRTTQDYKTQFTQKEIDKIKEEQHTDLSEFRQIPVEEVEEQHTDLSEFRQIPVEEVEE